MNEPILQVEFTYSFTTEEQAALCLVRVYTENDTKGYLLNRNEVPLMQSYPDVNDWIKALCAVVGKK